MRDFVRKVRDRFYRSVTIDVEDDTFAMMLQMGWVEKFMGDYVLTRKGYAEFKAFMKGNNADIRS